MERGILNNEGVWVQIRFVAVSKRVHFHISTIEVSIDSGGNICVNSLRAVIEAWLNASRINRIGVRMNTAIYVSLPAYLNLSM